MKKMKLFTAAAVMALALAAVGCGKVEESDSMMSIVIENEKSCEIELSDTDEGSSVSTAALVVEEGEEIVVEPALEEESKVVIQLKAGAENEDIDTLPDTENPDYEITVIGSGVLTCTVDPGSYRVTALPEKNTNGTITMTVQATAQAQTETDATAEADAGKRRRAQALIPWQILTACRSLLASSEQWAASHTAIWTAWHRSSSPQQRSR